MIYTSHPGVNRCPSQGTLWSGLHGCNWHQWPSAWPALSAWPARVHLWPRIWIRWDFLSQLGHGRLAWKPRHPKPRKTNSWKLKMMGFQQVRNLRFSLELVHVLKVPSYFFWISILKHGSSGWAIKAKWLLLGERWKSCWNSFFLYKYKYIQINIYTLVTVDGAMIHQD